MGLINSGEVIWEAQLRGRIESSATITQDSSEVSYIPHQSQPLLWHHILPLNHLVLDSFEGSQVLV